jgi:hypothetical protein
MTNFDDEILLGTEEENYIITSSNPEDFIIARKAGCQKEAST